MNEKRYTPENITKLKRNEIFVFGSNEIGVHGGGAARVAYDKFGAQWRVGVGVAGSTYALPTKDMFLKSLPIETIKVYIRAFVGYVLEHPEKTFYLTKIGCGLAGFSVKEISGAFWQVVEGFEIKKGNLPSNLIIPKEFDN